MKKMIALRRHAYGVGNKENGERYEASDQEARVLVALGWAKYDEGDADAPPADTATVAPEAAVDVPAASEIVAPADTDAPPAPAAAKRTYQRRDMKAKG